MTVAAMELVRPAHLWVPERRGSYGDEAVDLAATAGRELDDEDRLAVDAMLSYGPGGRWLTLEQVIIEARQNGKTYAMLEPVVMFDLWMLPPDKIVWTAHQFKTARDAFDDFCVAIATSPALSRRVKRIDYSHGEESIELHHPDGPTGQGAKLEFLARSQGGGRGKGGKRNVFDEALILDASRMGSLMPTLSARDDPQLTYGSSAGLLGSAHLRSLRNRGRAGGDPTLIYIEFSDSGSWEDPPCSEGKRCSHLYGVAGCALDEEDRWRAANHTLGRRPIDGGTAKHGITLAYVRAERRTLPPLEFGRERMGWWEDPPNEGENPPEIDSARWQRLADPMAPQPIGEVALAVEVPFDRSSTSIAASWWLGERVMVMVTELAGTSRAAAVVKALTEAHDVVDTSLRAGSPAGGLLERLEHEGVEVRSVSAQEDAQATAAFLDLITPPQDEAGNVTDEKLIGHLDQAALNAAVAVVRTRKVGVGGGKVWVDPEDLTNIAPLRAAALAAQGCVKHSKPSAPFFGAWR